MGHDDIERCKPDVSGFILVAVDGRDNWEHPVGLVPADADQGVHTEVPGGVVVVLTVHHRALKVSLQDVKNNGENLFVGEQPKGHDDGVLPLDRRSSLVKLLPEVGDPLLGDNGAVLVAELAVNLGGVVFLCNRGDAGLLQEAAEAEDSRVPDIGFALDGLKELLKKVGSGSNNGPWEGKEDGGDLAAPELTTLNKGLEELDGLRGATHHHGVNKDVPGKILLAAAGADDALIDPLEHGPVKHLECVGEDEDLPRHLGFREGGGVDNIMLDDFLDERNDLPDQLLGGDPLTITLDLLHDLVHSRGAT